MSFNKMLPYEYKTVYARFNSGTTPQEFINLAGGVQNKKVLDICCGDGRIANLCLEKAAAVYAVDQSPTMIQELKENVAVYNSDVMYAFTDMKNRDVIVDVAFCRQAVNYWLNEDKVKSLAAVISDGGFFIFNTFNKKPELTPQVREYHLENREYVEVSWSVNDIVHHVQCCAGYPPHVTEFSWISPYRFRALLEPWFVCAEIKKGKSSIYCCQRKAND